MKFFLFLVLTILMAGCNPASEEKPPVSKETNPAFFWSAAWHPNKEQVVAGGTQGVVRLFSTSDFQATQDFPYPGTITKTKWHPTQNKVAISVQDGISKPSILNLDDSIKTELDSICEAGARAIGWNQSGDLLAVGDYEGDLVFFNKTGDFLKKIDTGQKGLIGLDWHPQKNLLVAVGERIAIYDYDKDTLVTIEDREKEVLMLCVDWHPSGEFFVTGDYGDFIEHYPPLLQYWSAQGERIQFIEASKAEYRNLEWSKDGEILATASEKIRLWDKDGNLIREEAVENLLWGIDWSPDDSKLVTTDEKGGITIWDSNLNSLEELKY